MIEKQFKNCNEMRKLDKVFLKTCTLQEGYFNPINIQKIQIPRPTKKFARNC